MPERAQNRQTPCPLWVWAILVLGLILLYMLYAHATSEKALSIQRDIQNRAAQNLLDKGPTPEIAVLADGRDITLSGVVTSENERETAELIAKKTIGVRHINNQISLQQDTVASELEPEQIAVEKPLQAKLEALPNKFPALPIAQAKVEPIPKEFAPLEDDEAQVVEAAAEKAQEKFDQLDFSNITFEKNSTALTVTAQRTLDSAAKALVENPSVNIHVEGHTDSSGNPEGNLRISKKRAQAVVEYLANAGVEKTRIEASGFGDQFPIAPNETQAGRIKNRRIEIKVKNGE